MLKNLKSAAMKAALGVANNGVFPKPIEISGRELAHSHDLHADIARVLFFENEVRKLLPGYLPGKILTATIIKQWENGGYSQPYLDAVKTEFATNDGGSYSVDLWYFPDKTIWQAEVHRHPEKGLRYTYKVRRPDNEPRNPLALEDAGVHKNIEREWKLAASAK